MKNRKIIALFLCFGLLLCLTGCGAASMDLSNGAEMEAPEYVTDAGLTKGESTSAESQQLPENRKLIQKLWLDAETDDLDALLSQVNTQISQLEGYVEGQQIYNGSAYSGVRYRNAELTVRIPAQQLDNFVSQVSDLSNIVSSRKTTEDITLNYVATESRLSALETEQTRLLELLAQAETMEDLLLIESRLTDVRANLEQVTSTLRVYDNQVDYATVYLDIQEVREYTITEEPETVWDRMGTGFVESLQELGDFFVELFVWLFVNIPYLVILAVVVFVAILILKARKKKKSRKKTEEADK